VNGPSFHGGDSEAERFASLVGVHYEPLYRAAYRLTRSAHDAEDLVQEVCARAYPRLSELASLEKPRAWLMRVLYRLYIDSSRRYERGHVSPLAEDDRYVSGEPGPLEETDRALARRRLARAWQRLQPEQRVLLAMHDVEGHTLAEIQAATGLKEGTIKSRLHRARVRLGRLLQRDAGGFARVGAGEAE
jgi:RNA polymerase sigma-70 factor (ECF subfamily)